MAAAGWLARRQLVRKGTGDDSPCAHSALEIAFRKKLGVSIENGKARNPNFGGQHSGRWNTLPWPQATIDNRGAIGVINLPMKSLRALPANRDHGENPGSDPLHFPDRSGYVQIASSGY
jgi:hypothetical protein